MQREVRLGAALLPSARCRIDTATDLCDAIPSACAGRVIRSSRHSNPDEDGNASRDQNVQLQKHLDAAREACFAKLR
jgi:triphosphoribosyl-dephospho-CoA synthetase